MLRVTVYLKSGVAAEFEAEAVIEDAGTHPKFRLDFPAPEEGGRRLVYLDRDDVSAVVVEDAGEARRARHAAEEAVIALPDALPIRAEEEEVLTLAGAASGQAPIAP